VLFRSYVLCCVSGAVLVSVALLSGVEFLRDVRVFAFGVGYIL